MLFPSTAAYETPRSVQASVDGLETYELDVEPFEREPFHERAVCSSCQSFKLSECGELLESELLDLRPTRVRVLHCFHFLAFYMIYVSFLSFLGTTLLAQVRCARARVRVCERDLVEVLCVAWHTATSRGMAAHQTTALDAHYHAAPIRGESTDGPDGRTVRTGRTGRTDGTDGPGGPDR